MANLPCWLGTRWPTSSSMPWKTSVWKAWPPVFTSAPTTFPPCCGRRRAIPFRQHVRKRRMEMAKTMLADPRLSIAEIAQAVGYSQYTTFYNLFREMEGVSPTDYRNSLL